MSNPFPIVERRHKLLVGLNWSTWVEGEGLTETAARHDLMAKCLSKHSQRMCDRVADALQTKMGGE